METKDWIVMTVPIIVNGIVLFMFQKWFSTKIERNNEAFSRKTKILDEARQLTLQSVDALQKLIYTNNKGGNGLFEFEIYQASVKDLIDYFYLNKAVLSKYISLVDELVSSLNKFIEAINQRNAENVISNNMTNDFIVVTLNRNAEILDKLHINLINLNI